MATADPNPFRDEVRRLAAEDRAKLIPLIDRPEWDGQPAGLVVAHGSSAAIPLAGQRRLLARLAAERGADFSVMMQLGSTYPTDTQDGAGARVRWFQGAVVLRPTNTAAQNNLGISLRDAGDLVGAVAALRETIRLDPKLPYPHANLGIFLRESGDLVGAVAAFHEAIGLDPK